MRGFDSPELMCRVNKLEYDFNRREGSLLMPEGNCVDMRGCINLFKRIDSMVARINTYEGENRDTVYVLEGNEWKAGN